MLQQMKMVTVNHFTRAQRLRDEIMRLSQTEYEQKQTFPYRKTVQYSTLT